jgi:hypothetical protein
MGNITLDGLPAKSGTVSDSALLHLRESGVDKKLTVADFLTKVSSQYQTFMQTFLLTADKAAARAALDIARSTTVNDAAYTILATDKFVSQIGTMTASRAWTLPAANAYPAGEELVLSDKSYTVSSDYPIVVSRAGSDTFNDGSTSVSITKRGGVLRLISDGTSKWTILLSGSPALSANSSTVKNALINSEFNIWQRATSFSSVASGTYTADRWRYVKATTGAVHDISRSTDVPTVAQAGRLFNYSALIDCTIADAAVAAGDLVYYQQKILGYNFLPFAQKSLVLSFWVKGTKTGIHCVSVSNSAKDRSYVGEYTINTADTWEYKTVTVTASPSAGTWDYSTGIGLHVNFTLMAGTTYQTTGGAWQTGEYYATGNQVNACDSTSNNFRVTGVQLEANTEASPLEVRTYEEELENCLPYCQKLFGDASVEPINFGNFGSVTTASTYVRYRKKMVGTPTVTLSDVTHFSIGNNAVSRTATNTVVSNVGRMSLSLDLTFATVTSIGNGTGGNVSTGSSGYILLDAEI